jgi:hypothetical protein
VPDPRQVPTDLGVVLTSVLVTGALVVLMPFPSDLVNRTYARHHDEILGWFGPVAGLRRVAQVQGNGLQHWLAFGAFSILNGALFSLLNPALGLDTVTLATVVGMAGAIFAFTVAWGLASSLYLHRRMEGVGHHLRVVLSALPLAALCVLASRLAHFQPGYLYGLIAAFVFTRPLSRSLAGSSIAVSATFTAALAVAAWFARVPVGPLASGAHPPFAAVAANTFLTAFFVLGIEHLVFRLMPIRFLDGARLRDWSTVAWVALFGIGVLGFLHVLIDPANGYAHLANSKRAGLLTTVVLFLGFGLFSVAFWGYFRFRPRRPAGVGGGR